MDLSKQDYVCEVLRAYRLTPTTCGVVRRNDRLIAAKLYDRRVPLLLVENALVLAAARRIFHRPDAPAPEPIRSLAYLLPVIDEVRHLRVSQNYFRYLRFRLDSASQKHANVNP